MPTLITRGSISARSYGFGASTGGLIPFNGFNTPAQMNGSTTSASMTSVTVNSSGLFVAVGYDGNNYPLYATSN